MSLRNFITPAMPVKSLKKKVVCLTQRNVNSQEIKEVDSSSETLNVPLYHQHSLYAKTSPQHEACAVAGFTPKCQLNAHQLKTSLRKKKF